MKPAKILLYFSLIILLGCNTDQNKDNNFSTEEFIKSNSTISKKDLNIKLDSILEKNKNISLEEKAIINFEKGKNYSNLYKDKEAKESFANALKLFKIAKSTNYTIKSLINLSNTNIYLKNYTDANSQAIEALDLAKIHAKNKLIASANNVLSNLYYINKDYTKATEYINNSIELQIKEKDSVNLSASYNNIAILYKNTNNVDKAIDYNYKSLEISKKLKDSVGIGKTYSNLGRLYILINEKDKALEFYKKAIKNNEQTSIINSIPYANIGSLYMKLKLLDSANNYYKKAVKKATIKNNVDQLQSIYDDLFEIAIKKNNPTNIIKYQIKKDSLKSSIDAQLEKERKKALVKEQKLFQSVKEITQIKRINYRNRIIFISLFTILLLLGIIFFQKNKNRALKLNEEKKSLELKVLRSQMNPHFIFNALSAIQNSILDNDQIKSAKYLSRFAKLIRQNFEFIDHKTISLKEELDALKNYLETQQMRFQNKFEYQINISENININLTEIPPLLLQPFIENSIEHGFKLKKEKGLITINISKQGNLLIFNLTDNGKGITPINSKNKTHSTDIFIKRLKLIGNKDEESFKINSSNKGTVINFSLKQ